MYTNMGMNDIAKVRDKLNSVSPCFCLAKWLHCTLHLMNGTNHSCYLPPTHRIPLDEIKRSPSALHNTSHKKEQRRLMLEGVRPKECGMCWSIEDLPGEHLSDRILRGTESWTAPHFDRIRQMPWDQDVYPTYLEVSFSPTCNFKCSYCSPHVSTKWHQEIKEHGAYRLSQHEFQNLQGLKDLMPIEDEGENPYVKAFWQWWPELYRELQVFRITGGEPLLSPSTWRVLEWIDKNPNPNLELDINSNFGVTQGLIDRMTEAVSQLLQDKKIRSFRLHTSVDSSGKQAEYIRHGLNFENYVRNVETFLTRVPAANVAFMCTYNALSVVGFRGLMEWVLSLRHRFHSQHRRVSLDLPHLTGPDHQSVRVLTHDFREVVRSDINYMKERLSADAFDSAFRQLEVSKLERVLSWMSQEVSPNELVRNQADFYLFFSEHDRRRGTDFLSTFPQMADFWSHCRDQAKGLGALSEPKTSV